MTKQVRVENADTSDHIVTVEVWEKMFNSEDRLVSKETLPLPTSLGVFTIWKERYLIIKEA